MVGDIERLPKWARDRIRQLERQAEECLNVLADGPADSDTFAGSKHDYDGARPVRPLHKGETITFEIDERTRLYVRIENGALTIMSANFGTDGQLVVIPRVSNVITVRTMGS